MPDEVGVPTLAEMLKAEEDRLRQAVVYITSTRVGSPAQLLGHVMEHLRGKANPAEVRRIIAEELARTDSL